MNNILIINLKRFGDIYQTAHLINSIQQSEPNSRIQLLVFEEFKNAAKSLKNVIKVHTINRKKIESFYKNNIYSDGLGINELEISLGDITNFPINEIINYSNDRVSTYLSSFIKASIGSNVRGISFTDKQTIAYSNLWSSIYNDVVTSDLPSPFSINDITHLISGIPYYNYGEKLKINPQHNEKAFNNLNKLRESKITSQSNDVSIIGIQLKASTSKKELSYQNIIETIEMLSNDSSTIPVLLLAPTATERDLANKINKDITKKILSVEADLIALPSVILNLDAVITPDTMIKHVCDLLETPCLEVSLGPSPMFKQGTSNLNSWILTRRVDQRSFSHRDQSETREQHLPSEIIFRSTLLTLGKIDLENVFLDQDTNWSLYQPIKDTQGTILINKDGWSDIKEEGLRLMSRQLIYQITDKEPSHIIYNELVKNFKESEIQEWAKEEKFSIAQVTKDLLSTLRLLIQTQENIKMSSSFVNSLGKLLEGCQNRKISSIPLLLFRAQLESLTSDNIEENLKEVESLLYKLKDQTQASLICFRQLDLLIQERKRRTASNKTGIEV